MPAFHVSLQVLQSLSWCLAAESVRITPGLDTVDDVSWFQAPGLKIAPGIALANARTLGPLRRPSAAPAEGFNQSFFCRSGQKEMFVLFLPILGIFFFFRIVFDQSSLVHHDSESRGGTKSLKQDEGRTEILVSNIG